MHYRSGHWRQTQNGAVWVNGHDVNRLEGYQEGHGQILEGELAEQEEWVRLGYKDKSHWEWGELLSSNEKNFNVYFDDTRKQDLTLEQIKQRNTSLCAYVAGRRAEQNKQALQQRTEHEMKQQQFLAKREAEKALQAEKAEKERQQKVHLRKLFILAILVLTVFVVMNPSMLVWALVIGLAIIALPFALTIAAGFMAWYGGMAIFFLLLIYVLG